jgi:hypothetical protein
MTEVLATRPSEIGYSQIERHLTDYNTEARSIFIPLVCKSTDVNRGSFQQSVTAIDKPVAMLPPRGFHHGVLFLPFRMSN